MSFVEDNYTISVATYGGDFGTPVKVTESVMRAYLEAFGCSAERIQRAMLELGTDGQALVTSE